MVSYAWGLAVMRALKHGYKNRSTLNQNCANVQLCNLENLVTMVMVKMVKMWFGFGHFAHYNNKYKYLFYSAGFDIVESAF